MNALFVTPHRLFTLLLLIAVPLSAQERDVIHLKNGRSVTGTILERIPDKTVVIETKEGVEFVDYSDIRRIAKEFVPQVENFAPVTGAPGTVVRVNGTFPAQRPADGAVLFGDAEADVVSWSKNRIDVRVPEGTAGERSVTVVVGPHRGAARTMFTVGGAPAEAAAKRRAVTVTPAVRQDERAPEEEGIDLSGFWLTLGFVMPHDDLGMSDLPSMGFAKNGFMLGYEGRIHLASFLYLPLSFQAVYMGYDTDKLSSLTGTTVSSEGGSYGMVWFAPGVGLALPLSNGVHLHASVDYGVTMVHRPDRTTGTLPWTKQESANTFTGGLGFSVGITVIDAVIIGYREHAATPVHTVTVSNSLTTVTKEVEVEQKTSVGIVYVAFTF